MHLLYLANSYFYNCKPYPHILHQHCVLQNLRKSKDISIMKPNKGNGAVILDRKLDNNAIEIIEKLKKLFQTVLNSKSSMKTHS